MPTTNPVPSTDPSDLLFNAGRLDEVVNGTANSFTDRLGVSRRTVAGMNADFDAQLADAESDLNVYRADAAASAADALGYLQTIRATSYGAYASDPATDPLGNPPTVGDEYFNTTSNLLKRWNGTTWQASDINTANLAAPSGSSLVGYDGGTVQDVLDGAVSKEDYAALRAYAGRAKRIYITGLLVTAKPSGIAGPFQHDPTDTTSLDNGGTIIVLNDGRRFKRDFTGEIKASWFNSAVGADVDYTQAIRSAITAAGSIGTVVLPDGDCKTTADIEVPNLINIEGTKTRLLVAYNGVGFRFIGISSGASRNSNKISGVQFMNAPGFTPFAFIEIGKETPSSVGLNVTLEKCLFIGCAANYGVLNTSGYGTTLRECVFNSFIGTCIKTRQSPTSDTPYWTYSMNLYSCDITNITGKGLDIAVGDVMIYGGIIEGCSQGGIDFYTNTTGTRRANVACFGTYFEGNQGHHIKSSNPNTGGSAQLSLTACRFTAGAYASNLLLSNCSATLTDCTGIPSCTITGGTVRLINTYGMFSDTSSVSRIVADNWVQQSATPATPVNLGRQINVNATNGGGAALILCSHQNTSGNGTNAEFFLVRYGNDGNNFSALSLGRSVGSDTNAYTFTVDANGILQVASGAGNARYMVVANMRGSELAL